MPCVLKGEAEGQSLRDRLDCEGFLRVSHAVHAAPHRNDGKAEIVGMRLPEFGDVISHGAAMVTPFLLPDALEGDVEFVPAHVKIRSFGLNRVSAPKARRLACFSGDC